mgnify:CR=1 FL=1
MTDNENRTCEKPMDENKRIALTDEQLQEVTVVSNAQPSRTKIRIQARVK